MSNTTANIDTSAAEFRALLCCTAPDTRMQTKTGEHLAGEQAKTLHCKYRPRPTGRSPEVREMAVTALMPQILQWGNFDKR